MIRTVARRVLFSRALQQQQQTTIRTLGTTLPLKFPRGHLLHGRRLLQNQKRLLPSLTNIRHHTEHIEQEIGLGRPKGQTADELNLNGETKRLSVRFGDGETCEYPYIWLRDNCQCERCFHPTTLSRLIRMKEHDLAIEPAEAQVSPAECIFRE